VSSAELVFGQPWRIHGEFLPSVTENWSAGEQLARHDAHRFLPVPTSRHGARSSHVPSELCRAQFVFVRRDAHRTPLQAPYTGPFRVLEVGDKSFLLAVGGRQDRVSIDRLKPAHLDPVPLQQESQVMRQERFLILVVPPAGPTLIQLPCTTLPPAPPPDCSPVSPPVPADRPSSSPVHGSPITPPTPAGYRTRSGRLVIPPRRLTYHIHADSGGAYVAEPQEGDISISPNTENPHAEVGPTPVSPLVGWINNAGP